MPSAYVNEQVGSNTNPRVLLFLEDSVNAAKGRLENFKRPMADSVAEELLEEALKGNETSAEAYVAAAREVSHPKKAIS